MSYRLKALLIVSLLVVMLLPLGTSFAVDSCTQVHTVVTGETLYRISLRYNVSMATLQAWNGISNPNRIQVAQRLCVSVSPASYVVQRGDTMSSIARRYGVTVTALAQANNIVNTNRIYPGQRLFLP
jgi:spore germination protein